MARRRTYCRYCYEAGHTRRTCPKLKVYIAENPASYMADLQKTHCSFCKQTGHSRLKCEQYAEHMRQKRIAVLETRTNFCQKISQLGIMPGTLVKAEFYNNKIYSWDHTLALVTRIDWENIHNNTTYGIYAQSLVTGEETSVSAPDPYGYSRSTVIVSALPYEKAYEYNSKLMEKTNDKIEIGRAHV